MPSVGGTRGAPDSLLLGPVDHVEYAGGDEKVGQTG